MRPVDERFEVAVLGPWTEDRYGDTRAVLAYGRAPTFTEVLSLAEHYAATYPIATIEVCDFEQAIAPHHDGLDNEQRAELLNAIYRVRSARSGRAA